MLTDYKENCLNRNLGYTKTCLHRKV